jgi:HPt (histidine-containing phosphotransfer) domain-containing protein
MGMTTGAPAQLPTLDLLDLLRRLGGDAALAAECGEIFCADAERRLAEADMHVAIDDLDAIGRQCHSLKGAAATAGARAFEQIAFEAERSSANRDRSALTVLLGDMQLELGRVRLAVARLRIPG